MFCEWGYSNFSPSLYNNSRCVNNVYAYLLSYSMEQRPSWEANRSSANQEIPRILQNPKFHYRIHNPTSHFLNIHLNITLPSTPGSPTWPLSLRFPHQNPVHASHLPHTRYMSRPSHSSRLYHPKNIGWAVEIIQLLIMQLPLLPCYLVPPRPKYSQHPILKHPQPSSSLNVSDKVSHPYNTTGRIIVLYILSLNFWIANWKTKDFAPNDSKHSVTSICSPPTPNIPKNYVSLNQQMNRKSRHIRR